MSKKNSDIIVIVGPTGVGKTKLSIELAKLYDAEIINGDSVSIYKNLNIGSAKPTIEEQDGIIHHLIDIKEIYEDYSIYDYQKDVRNLISEIRSRNKNIIIVGGSGLYLKAALYDYEFNDGTTYNNYDELSNEEIYNKIKDYDSSIDIHPNNRVRLVRTLNKIDNNEELGKNKSKLLYNIKTIGLTTERDILYERINLRVDKMMEEGLLKEVESLKDYYNKSRVLNTAIGYKEFYDYFYNKKDLYTVINEIKQNSRRYAKRQYTFFNHQMDVNWFNVNFNNFDETIKIIEEFLKK